MIRPIAPTHSEAKQKADRINQTAAYFRDARRSNLLGNLAYSAFVLIVTGMAIIAGRLLYLFVSLLT